MKTKLRIASCQFYVEGDIGKNRAEILRLIDEAAARGARAAHFSEAALSGYGAFEVQDTQQIDWDLLTAATNDICAAARRHRMWVLLGSSHRLTPPNRPHNSVYVINDQGQIVDRYDKRFCTGVLEPRPTLDHCHYTPGNRPCIFEIDGYRCGVLICYDYRFTELYRELKQAGVEILFHSYHNARRDFVEYAHRNLWKELVPATMMAAAGANHFWISATNSTSRYSLWPSFFVRPDGLITGRLDWHQAGVMISDVDPTLEFWDAAAPWRTRAISGTLHSGQLVDDPRSSDRHAI
jgi:predicted amidohydrolase